ncbi:MAG: hypothetical protein ACT6FG_00040 [Methanosarcinaceae archaeon]
MTIEPGERAGAVISIHGDSKKINLAGYGVYKGYEIPLAGIVYMGVDMHDLKRKNPRIDLDNGHTIWGCQCYWGSEEAMKKRIATYIENGYIIEIVDPSYYD